MAIITIISTDKKTSVDVELAHVSDPELASIKQRLLSELETEQAYQAIANAFTYAVETCPFANPSDLWQHIIYRTYMNEGGRSDQSWKRASGQGFECAIVQIYNPRLAIHGLRLVLMTSNLAKRALAEMQLENEVPASKMDIAIEGNCNLQKDAWRIFGVIHAKTSIAERINDDAPASRKIMEAGFVSLAVTLDSKSFPPPHGNGINYGELGGRTNAEGIKENQQKRNYFERDGDFTNCYSYNLRTPPSAEVTPSGTRIKTLSFQGDQPDEFVVDIINFWQALKPKICQEMPVTAVK